MQADQADHSTPADPSSRLESDFQVDSHSYACRCGSVVYWRATASGLVIVDPDGHPHRERCPRRSQTNLTPRDRYYLACRDRHQVPAQPTVVVTAEPSVDRAAMNRIVDTLAELPLAIDEVRVLGQAVARYAAQVDRRSAVRTREQRVAPNDQPPPPASTPGEPTRGASVVRTSPRPGPTPD